MMRKGRPAFWREVRREGVGERGWIVTLELFWSSACRGESAGNSLASNCQNREEEI